MTREKLEKEAAAYAKRHRMLSYCWPADTYVSDEKEIIKAILHFAEPMLKDLENLEGIKLAQATALDTEYMVNESLKKDLKSKDLALEDFTKWVNNQLTKAKELIKELYNGLDKLYLSGLSDKQIAFIEKLQDKVEVFLKELEE